MAIPPSASDVWPPRSIMAGRQASRAMEDDNALLTRSPLRLLGRVLLPLSDYKIALSFPLHFPFPAPTTITCRPFCLAAASPRHSIRRRVRSSELWCSTSQTTDSKRQMCQTLLSNHDDVVGAKQTKAAEQSRQSPALVVTLAVLFAPVWPVVCQE